MTARRACGRKPLRGSRHHHGVPAGVTPRAGDSSLDGGGIRAVRTVPVGAPGRRRHAVARLPRGRKKKSSLCSCQRATSIVDTAPAGSPHGTGSTPRRVLAPRHGKRGTARRSVPAPPPDGWPVSDRPERRGLSVRVRRGRRKPPLRFGAAAPHRQRRPWASQKGSPAGGAPVGPVHRS